MRRLEQRGGIVGLELREHAADLPVGGMQEAQGHGGLMGRSRLSAVPALFCPEPQGVA
jgi:hypothetical protein